MYVADGNWKLKYPHCMWKVPITVEGLNQVNYPNICPLSPERGQAFCKSHCEMAAQKKIPHGLHEFLQYCGIQGNCGLDHISILCCACKYFLLLPCWQKRVHNNNCHQAKVTNWSQTYRVIFVGLISLFPFRWILACCGVLPSLFPKQKI